MSKLKLLAINRPSLLAVVWLFLLTAGVYGRSIGFAFVDWDDRVQVLNNPEVAILGWQSIVNIFSKFYAQMYQPLATLSFSLEHRLVGNAAWLYHLDNFWLHLINACLVFWLSRLIFKRHWPALLAASLFAVWPTQAEVVAWVSARSALLSSGFMLAALIAYWRYKKDEVKHYRYLLYLFTVLAMLSKSIAIVLPLLFLLLDAYWGKLSWKNFFKLSPFWLLAMVFGVLTILGRQSFITSADTSWLESSGIVLFAITRQLRLMFWPFGLNPFYSLPAPAGIPLGWTVWVAGALPCLILIWGLIRKDKKLLLLFLFFLLNIILGALLSIFINTAGADRYNYLAVLALIWPLCYFIFRLKKSLRLTIVLALIIILSTVAATETLKWRDSLSLWQTAVDRNPTESIALNSLAAAQFETGQEAEALLNAQLAAAFNPHYSESYNTAGIIWLKHRLYRPALKSFNQAIRLNPDNGFYYYNRGLTLQALDRLDLAIIDFRLALKLISPEDDDARAKAETALLELTKLRR